MADTSLIQAMARDLWLEHSRSTAAERRAMGRIPDDGKDIDPAWYDEDAAMPLTGPGFVAKWEGLARAALRSMHERGPSPTMLRAMLAYAERQIDDDDADAADQAKVIAWDAAQAFRHGIAAELEEANG
ncbi:hypothetical protein ACJ41P_10495 [Azospirillum argentinense]|uniref:Uncharacterized protein n=1 Tax=Azospirillum argentinense TaxID=2970906 RepID=A0ABW8V4X6_9PROT